MQGPGMHLRLSHAKGFTAKGVLSEPYFFQCAPIEELALDHAFDRQTYTTVTEGEFSRKGGRKLRTMSFDTLAIEGAIPPLTQPLTQPGGLPGQRLHSRGTVYPSWVSSYDASGKEGARKGLEHLLNSGSPFRLLVVRNGSTFVNMLATLDSLRVSEKTGEEDTYYFTVGFTEWRAAYAQRDGNTDGASKQGSKVPRHAGKFSWPHTITLNKDGSYVGLHHLSGSHPLTIAGIALLLYRSPSRTTDVAKAIGITDWGVHTPLIDNPRFKGKGGKIVCPSLRTETLAVPGDALGALEVVA